MQNNNDKQHSPLSEDPRLTAYALGEMEVDERQEFEALLAKDEDMRGELEALQAFTAALTQDFQQEPQAALTKNQRELILQTAEQPAVAAASVGTAKAKAGKATGMGKLLSFRVLAGVGTLAAASVLVIAVWRDSHPEISYGYLGFDDAVAQAPGAQASTMEKSSSTRTLGRLGYMDDDGDGDELRYLSQSDQERMQELRAPNATPTSANEAEVLRGLGYIDGGGLETDATRSAGDLSESERGRLRTIGYFDGEGSAASISPAETEELKSLGYVDSEPSGALADGPSTPKPDGAVAKKAPSPSVSPTVRERLRKSGKLTDKEVLILEDGDGLYRGPGDTTPPGGGGGGGDAVAGSDDFFLGRGAKRQEAQTRLDEYAKVVRKVEMELAAERVKAERAANTEDYAAIIHNPFTKVASDPRSTFSIDVDTASYANVRRFLSSGQLPPPDAVRLEEMVNYFDYEYPQPAGDVPFSVTTELAGCPWMPGHQLLRIGMQGRQVLRQDKLRNLVFLVDVSGSMNSPDKLELLKQGLKLLVEQLTRQDSVAIAVYAGASGLALPPTPCSEPGRIAAALEQLSAGGSTNGGEGIELAYKIAKESFIKGGVNRVVLCTDGDFNVGTTSQGELLHLIEEKRKTGVFLSVLGFGSGNLKDSTMEMLANKGNGNYHYIDSLREAQKVLVRDMNATLETIAKDVKIQIEFNPAEVQGFRLIGYENRVLAHQDFNDDTKDAGEIGAGHRVTALYQLVPRGVPFESTPEVDPLKYQPSANAEAHTGVANGELLTIKLRYKQPDGDKSSKVETTVRRSDRHWNESSADFRFATGVALFGMLLRQSPYCANSDFSTVMELAQEGAGPDPWGYRAEFLGLVRKAKSLQGTK